MSTSSSKNNLIETNTKKAEELDKFKDKKSTIKKKKTCFLRMSIMLFSSFTFFFLIFYLKIISCIQNLNVLWAVSFFTACLPVNAFFVYFWKNGYGFRK